jgi:diguanylate cyclase (GGDEF)-like protein
VQLPFSKREHPEALAQPDEIQRLLKDLEKRDLWLWVFSIAVTMVLAGGLVTLSLSAMRFDLPPFLKFELEQSVRGLIGLVMLFAVYTVYQLFQIHFMRNALIEQRLRAEEYRQLALFDPLTGVYNRRAVEMRIGEEIKRCTRRKVPLTLVVLDLNDFKEINDTHGHLAGDVALKEFAQCLKRASRGSDIVGRLGGDEFMILLPECTLMQLKIVLRRLDPLEIEFQKQRIKFSFSAGWATYVEAQSAEEFIHSADQALYARKKEPTVVQIRAPEPEQA